MTAVASSRFKPSDASSSNPGHLPQPPDDPSQQAASAACSTGDAPQVALLEWLHTCGARVHPSLTVSRDSAGGFGLFTTGAIPGGDELFAVPRAACMLEAPANLAGRSGLQRVALCLALLREQAAGAASPLAPYIACLPDAYSLSHVPLLWPAAGPLASALSTASPAGYAAWRVHQALLSAEYSSAVPALLAAHPELRTTRRRAAPPPPPLEVEAPPPPLPEAEVVAVSAATATTSASEAAPPPPPVADGSAAHGSDASGGEDGGRSDSQGSAPNGAGVTTGDAGSAAEAAAEAAANAVAAAAGVEEYRVPSKAQYAWARAILSSRSVSLWGGPTFVPLMDFLNHARRPAVVCGCRGGPPRAPPRPRSAGSSSGSSGSNTGSGSDSGTDSDDDRDSSASSSSSSGGRPGPTDGGGVGSDGVTHPPRMFVGEAVRDIPAGAELTWHYNASTSDVDWLMGYGFVPSDGSSQPEPLKCSCKPAAAREVGGAEAGLPAASPAAAAAAAPGTGQSAADALAQPCPAEAITTTSEGPSQTSTAAAQGAEEEHGGDQARGGAGGGSGGGGGSPTLQGLEAGGGGVAAGCGPARLLKYDAALALLESLEGHAGGGGASAAAGLVTLLQRERAAAAAACGARVQEAGGGL